MTENLTLIMVIKTDIMNLNWSLYNLIPLSLCKKMNYHKLWFDTSFSILQKR